MVLSSGETITLGDRISVGEGKNSFIGSQINDWMRRPDSVNTVEKFLGRQGWQGTPEEEKALAERIVKIARGASLYQLRSEAQTTYYQGFVISLPVTAEDAAALKDLSLKEVAGEKAAAAEAAPAEGTAPVKEEAAAKKILPDSSEFSTIVNRAASQYMTVTNTPSWKNGRTKNGLAYRHGTALVDFRNHNMKIPLSLDGYVTEENGSTYYTVLIADQASGAYFAPYLEKAFQGAEK